MAQQDVTGGGGKLSLNLPLWSCIRKHVSSRRQAVCGGDICVLMIEQEVDPSLLLTTWPSVPLLCLLCHWSAWLVWEQSSGLQQAWSLYWAPGQLCGSAKRYYYFLEQLSMLEKIENKPSYAVSRETFLPSWKIKGIFPRAKQVLHSITLVLIMLK